MSTDSDDMIDPALLPYEEEDGEEFGGEDFEDDDEGLDNIDGNEDIDENGENEEFADEDEGEEVNGGSLIKRNGARMNGRGLGEDEEDMGEMSGEEAEETNAKGEEDEEKIMEEIRRQRVTYQKFFNVLAGRDKNAKIQEDNEEDQENEDQEEGGYIIKVDEHKLDETIDDEKLKKIQEEKSDFVELINEMKASIFEVKQKFLPILARLKNRKVNMKEGMNYLDAKFHLMNMYCQTLSFYMLLKVQGKSIKDHPAIRRLIYLKTLVNKVKPLDKKLEYQINKLLRMANEETLVGESYAKRGENDDPLALKPKPETMAKTLTTDDIDITEGGEIIESRASKEGIYRPSKMRAVLMEEEDKTNKEKREEDRSKRRIMKDKFIKELQGEYGDEPVEIKNYSNLEMEEDKRDKDIREYEERNFTRLLVTKDDKKRRKLQMKKMQRGEDLDDFSEFEKVREYFREEAEQKEKKQDEIDKLKRKSMADYLTKRKHEKLQDGDGGDDFVDDDIGEHEGKQFFGGRKKVKQEGGQFHNKRKLGKPSKEDFSGPKGRGNFGKGTRGKGSGFSRGNRGGKRRF